MCAIIAVSMSIATMSCPSCGAPLRIAGGQTHAICAYCNRSLRLTAPAAHGGETAESTLAPDDMPPEEIEQVKQLVLDGKRDEAIAHYARFAGLPPADAARVVDQVVLPAVQRLMRELPINAFGFFLTLVIAGGGVALSAWGVSRALGASPGFWLLAAAAAYLAVLQMRWFLPKASSTLVDAFGAAGRARVMNCKVLRPGIVQGGTLVLLAFSVEPSDGSVPFVVEDVLLLADASLPKLAVGNVVRVRFDGRRRRVFPITPIEVEARGAM